MKIIIDGKAGLMAVDGVTKRVTIPAAYVAPDLLYFDTESLGGFGNTVDNRLSTGSILAVSLALWHASTTLGPAFTVDKNGAVLNGKGAPGVPGAQGKQGLKGDKGDMGTLSDMVADPLAYYILAKA